MNNEGDKVAEEKKAENPSDILSRLPLSAALNALSILGDGMRANEEENKAFEELDRLKVCLLTTVQEVEENLPLSKQRIMQFLAELQDIKEQNRKIFDRFIELPMTRIGFVRIANAWSQTKQTSVSFLSELAGYCENMPRINALIFDAYLCRDNPEEINNPQSNDIISNSTSNNLPETKEDRIKRDGYDRDDDCGSGARRGFGR